MRVRGVGNGTAGEEGGLSVAWRVTWIACIATGLTEAPDREQLKMRLCGAGCIPGAVWKARVRPRRFVCFGCVQPLHKQMLGLCNGGSDPFSVQ